MGVTIRSKNHSIDLGSGGFHNLRTKIAELVNNEIGEHYKHLNDAPWDEIARRKFFEDYDKEIKALDEKYEGKYNCVLYFLYAPDEEAEIPLDVCEQVYEVIKDYDDNVLYGYVGRKDCATFKDFKSLVKDCIDTRCGMEWY